MSARIVILSALDPRGEYGLTVDTRAAQAQGADVVPIATGVIRRDDDGRLSVSRLPARLLARALEEASAVHVDGMLVGMIPGYFQARVLARSLANWLPDTLVYAPLNLGFDSRPLVGGSNLKLQARSVLPETTVAVIALEHASHLLGQAGQPAATAAGSALLDAGCHAAWLIGRLDHGRGVDTVATAGENRLLDYPLDPAGGSREGVAGALAALLAQGWPLSAAIDAAHRYDSRVAAERSSQAATRR